MNQRIQQQQQACAKFNSDLKSSLERCERSQAGQSQQFNSCLKGCKDIGFDVWYLFRETDKAITLFDRQCKADAQTYKEAAEICQRTLADNNKTCSEAVKACNATIAEISVRGCSEEVLGEQYKIGFKDGLSQGTINAQKEGYDDCINAMWNNQ